ncbi:hypothetical protein ACOME3_002639 [Neoechinorhynchus agilis]
MNSYIDIAKVQICHSDKFEITDDRPHRTEPIPFTLHYDKSDSLVLSRIRVIFSFLIYNSVSEKTGTFETILRILRRMAKLSFAQNGSKWTSMSSKEYTERGMQSIPDRKTIEDTLKRRFFVAQSFELYGGVSGLYDFGPIGCSTKANLLDEWRHHFVIEEQMLEVETSMLTPEPVLQASGHVERFCDYMVNDSIKGDFFRADHLIEEHLIQMKQTGKLKNGVSIEDIDNALLRVNDAKKDDLAHMIEKFGVLSPAGNPLSQPVEFNLMFGTMLGATGLHRCYLRPETAQGIFVNFKRLLSFNQGRLPFAAAQIGYSFRNEIAPRSGLLRVREFPMAEIEHFVDPRLKSKHPKFDQIAEHLLTLFPRSEQLSGSKVIRLTVRDAVYGPQKCIDNETLAYFMTRIDMFLTKCGIDPDKLRFRQHLSNEMAHYACDCWDAECLSSYGWVECVGCADRSCYDLNQHSKATETDLVAERFINPPRDVEVYDVNFDRKTIGIAFKSKAQEICRLLSRMKQNRLKEIFEMNEGEMVKLNLLDSEVELKKEMITVTKRTRRIEIEEFVPSVIEPSFGIGRILDHPYFTLPNTVAPYICTVLPLSGQNSLFELCEEVSTLLKKSGIAHRVERSSSASIGKRYARCDEIGIPYGITIDFDSLKQRDCTIRQRDTMQQIRVKLSDLTKILLDAVNGNVEWSRLMEMYPMKK